MKRGVALVLLLSGVACGETSNDSPHRASGGSAGAATSTGDASCPAQSPTHGAPCQGVLSCNYHAFLGCYPSGVTAVCKQGRWDVPKPAPYTGPCPGDPIGPTPTCPAQQPIPGASCNQTPTLDGPPLPLVCEYVDPACVDERVATCNGQWTITPCVPVRVGGAGAGGEAAGGAPSDSGGGGAGGAE